MTSRHQSAREEKEENKKTLKIVTFDSRVSLVNTYVTGFGKEKEETFKNLGLVAAQYNDIAACAYYSKIFAVHALLYLTVYVVCR